jgi:hypothetical protein
VGRLQLLLDATPPAALTSNSSGDAMMCIVQSPPLFVPKCVWHVLGLLFADTSAGPFAHCNKTNE